VDDVELIARCEACGKPIFDGDRCEVNPEDMVYLCEECAKSYFDETNP
jgi:uncharacterized protein with PIN domain